MRSIQERLVAAFQAEHREHIAAVRAMLDALAPRGYDIASFDFTEARRRVHSLKGAARAVGLQAVEALSHRLETLMDRCQEGRPPLDARTAAAIRDAFDSIEDWTATLAGGAPPADGDRALAALDHLMGTAIEAPASQAPPAAPSAAVAPRRSLAPEESGDGPRRPQPAADMVRVSVAALDAVLDRTDELLGEDFGHRQVAQTLRDLRRDLEALERHAESGAGIERGLAAAIAKLKTASLAQSEAAWRLRKIGAGLFRDLRALRIVAADSVFGGVRKMVRDLARDEGKDVEVETAGLDVLAERQVLQALRDPVLHLLRNAVGHGIEAPSVRVRKGLPPAGHIAFRVAADRSRLILRIEDDGPGLDLERIRAEAERRGIALSTTGGADGGLTAVLVEPGFSTAGSVSEIAGRGMGLSIVDKAVRQIRGTFMLAPGPAGGTVAIIEAPLSVMGERVALVRSGGQTYGIPVHAIAGLRRLDPNELGAVAGRPVVADTEGGDPVPLARLAAVIGGAEAPDRHGAAALPAVILRHGPARLALAVDDFVAVQDAIIHDLAPAVPAIGLASGGIVLGDGSCALLLDVSALLAAAREDEGGADIRDVRPAPAAAPPTILVVDDSITTRTLEKSILEARGYRVRLGVDGIDALEQLRHARPDLVIADIEMPRMDGFELLHAIRGDGALKDLPVILVTSRDLPEDRRKGLALGAQAYIVKQRFDQHDLLEAIEQVL